MHINIAYLVLKPENLPNSALVCFFPHKLSALIDQSNAKL